MTRHTLSRWLGQGRKDIKNNKVTTAFARFAAHFDDVKEKSCNRDSNRIREFERALQIMEQNCECGREKMLLPDGTRADSCRRCQDLDTASEGRREKTGSRPRRAARG